MSTVDATDETRRPAGGRVPEQGAPVSPGGSAGWLLRAAAGAAVVAGALGVIVAPGLRGNAGERVVDWVDRGSATASYFLLLSLLAIVGWGAVELVRSREGGALSRLWLVASSAGVVTLVFVGLALHDRVASRATPAVLVAGVAAVCGLSGAYGTARAPHTRALSALLLAFALAAIARLGAWELATAASDRGDVRLYGVSRGLATAGVMLEAAGQLVAVTWLGTRSRLAGQLGSTAALAGAFALTWGVARGVHSGAALWQSILHTALGDAAGVPAPFGLDAVATFLVPASLLLALVTAAQPDQVPAILATMALALVSRGALDAPLRALCLVAAAQWGVLASHDGRAMWRTLIDDRRRRLEDE